MSEVISDLRDCAESDVDPRIAATKKEARTVRVVILSEVKDLTKADRSR